MITKLLIPKTFFQNRSIFRSLKKLVIFSLLVLIITLIFYFKNFKEIELVCNETVSKEVFLLNYVKKENLKSKIYTHNKKIKLQGNELLRIYLKNFILQIPDPIFNDKINYKKNGCKLIDNMDIYCEVHFRKLENGKISIWYNFME